MWLFIHSDMDVPHLSIEMLINLPILGWIAYRVWVLSTLIPGIKDKIADQDREIQSLRKRVHDLANEVHASNALLTLAELQKNSKS
jgi:hypothetical protein